MNTLLDLGSSKDFVRITILQIRSFGSSLCLDMKRGLSVHGCRKNK